MAAPLKSGATGDSQKGPTVQKAAATGQARIKGGNAPRVGDTGKGGARTLKSGAKGG